MNIVSMVVFLGRSNVGAVMIVSFAITVAVIAAMRLHIPKSTASYRNDSHNRQTAKSLISKAKVRPEGDLPLQYEE